MRASDPAVVQALVEKGADVNAKAEDGATPLIIAVGRGDPKVVKALLDNGADANAKDKNGRTALMRASFFALGSSSHQEIKDLLIKAGAK